MWKVGPVIASGVVGVGDGEGVGEIRAIVFLGGAQAAANKKKAAPAASHFPLIASLRTERDAKSKQCLTKIR
jgi:hypothetical protein